MDTLDIFRELAIIIIAAKVFGLLAKKLKAPQVAGEIIAGLLIGPSVLGFVKESDFLSAFAEIGVILLMFSAGLETNISDLKKTLRFHRFPEGGFRGNNTYGNLSQHNSPDSP